jgi:hypothetical protein
LILGPEIPQADAKLDEFSSTPDLVGPLDRGEAIANLGTTESGRYPDEVTA